MTSNSEERRRRLVDVPPPAGALPDMITVRGARQNNLQNLDIDVPLWRTVAVVGVSGSGKTSLAMGTLYAEGLQRLLAGLSTYSRRRLDQVQRPDVDRIEHLPATLALRQRPPIPGPRSTVGTMSEVLNVLRLMMSRLGSHVCPNGHRVERSDSGIGMEIICPTCGVTFERPGAETFAFNSYGACPACEGLGVRTEVNIDALVPDQDKTLEKGAVLSWNSGGRRLSMYAAGEQGVRLDIPFRNLTNLERDVVFHAPPEKFQVTVTSERTGRTVQLTVNYDNAVASAQRMLRGESARTRQLAERFTHTSVCSVCGGTRLRPEALASLLGGLNLAEVSALDLNALREFASALRDGLPLEIARMTEGLLKEFEGRLIPLLDVGLAYLTLDRTGSTLSTGERQRIELTSTVRANATGMLYVLDEPSVGLHPSNVSGLERTIHALVVNGNSVIIVEHELELIRIADWVIELGPDAGIGGGKIIAESRPTDLERNPNSIIGPYLSGSATVSRCQRPIEDDAKYIEIEIDELFNLRDVRAKFPMHRLTGVAGPSGAGKTALVLESLVPALRASVVGDALPPHVRYLETGGVRQVVEIDASPIGQNARSTPVTYTGAFDEIRRIFASSPLARRRRWKPGRFSFNTPEGQCPTCFGLGHIDLDVQYLPDISINCPTCDGARFNEATLEVRADGMTIADVLALSVEDALAHFADQPRVLSPLLQVRDVGLGYLRLGEPTPSLSGGESQRLRIASRLRSGQRDALYVFDEPTIGLHPRDVSTLLGVLDRLMDAGATVVVIDHDLDLLCACDYLIDLGPGAGPEGGRIVATGTPREVSVAPTSVTGPWLADHRRAEWKSADNRVRSAGP